MGDGQAEDSAGTWQETPRKVLFLFILLKMKHPLKIGFKYIILRLHIVVDFFLIKALLFPFSIYLLVRFGILSQVVGHKLYNFASFQFSFSLFFP